MKGSPVMTAESIRERIYEFQRIRAILTGYELGIFTAVGDGGKSSREIASTLRTDPRATDRLMNALCAIGFLRKGSGTFRNTPEGLRYLVEGSPEYMAGLRHSVHLWDTWSTLTEAVRKGTSVARRSGSVNDRGEEWLAAFIDAMHYRASRQAPELVGGIDLEGVKSVLDLGGGSGAFAMAFAAARSSLSAVVFDLPNVIPLTRTYIDRAGLSGRVRTVAGDYMTDDLGKGFDIVFLSAIIHSNSPEENRRLILKCAAALSHGGRVIVQDHIMDEDRVSPPGGAIFALNMLVGTTAGDTFTEAEVGGWMTDAGLSGITRKETPFGYSQMSGKKP